MSGLDHHNRMVRPEELERCVSRCPTSAAPFSDVPFDGLDLRFGALGRNAPFARAIFPSRSLNRFSLSSVSRSRAASRNF
jgi:hypothetical protein